MVNKIDLEGFDLWSKTDQEMTDRIIDWLNTARYNQVAPKDNWRIWLLLAGRGFGKTRTAAEHVRARAWRHPGHRVGVIAPSFADGRDICFEGESGLINIIPSSCIDVWNRSIGELKLINGSIFRLFSAEEPDRMRGHQFHDAWADELASYKGKISKKDAANEGVPGTPKPMLAQIELATRLKPKPQIVITTTPRPLRILKDIIARPSTRLSTGSTMENEEHLAKEFMESVLGLYEGTRLGRQELLAEILEDIDGALWTGQMIEDLRIDPKKEPLPRFKRIVVAVDPAVTANKRSNETGIVVAAVDFKNRGYILQDASGKYSPEGWADKTIALAKQWNATRIVGEKNQGGDMITSIIRSRQGGGAFAVRLVDAQKGKFIRAEPVAALYEQKRVFHYGAFPVLEEQMTTWTGEETEESPDRLDALVWAIFDLMLSGRTVPYVAAGNVGTPNLWTPAMTGSDYGDIVSDDFIQMTG